MDRNAIRFFKDHGEKKVRAVLRGDLAGAQFYEPNTKKIFAILSRCFV